MTTKNRILRALALPVTLAAALPLTAATPPQFQNVVAAQRPGTFLVDITYDLVDPDSSAVYVRVEASSNLGTNWLVPMVALSGDIGLVAVGTGKQIVWNAWLDWANNYTTNAKVRLIADDTLSAIAPPPTNAPAANLTWIPPGALDMSGTVVWISHSFWMGKYEVTQAEYQSVMSNNPSSFLGPNRPVDSATWEEAVLYCQQLTTRERAAGHISTNQSYRLPTEAEWEYACRAGTTTTFSYGDDPTFTRLGSYAWYSGNSSGTTHDVGQKGCNRWGLYDMMGNAWEWCSDWYGGLLGGNVTDPQGPSSGGYHVLRGGAWNIDASACASAARGGNDPAYRDGRRFGFRVVLAPGQ